MNGKKLSFVWLGVMFLFSLFRPFEAGAQELQIRLGYNKAWTLSALLVGKAINAYEKEGVKVTWLSFDNPNQIIEGIIAQAVDAGFATGPHLIVARERGVGLKAVAMLERKAKPNVGYIVRTDSGINKIVDLKGKKVGVNNYGGTHDIYLRYMLERNGLDPKRDVQILEVPIPTVIPALSTNQVDAGAVPGIINKLAQEQFKGKFKTLFSYDDIPDSVHNAILVMATRFMERNRPAARGFLRGYLKAVKFSKENPKEALDLWTKEAGIPLIARLDDFPDIPDDGKIGLEAMRLDIRLSKRYGYTRTEPPAEEMVDYTLLDEILAGEGRKR